MKGDYNLSLEIGLGDFPFKNGRLELHAHAEPYEGKTLYWGTGYLRADPEIFFRIYDEEDEFGGITRDKMCTIAEIKQRCVQSYQDFVVNMITGYMNTLRYFGQWTTEQGSFQPDFSDDLTVEEFSAELAKIKEDERNAH